MCREGSKRGVAHNSALPSKIVLMEAHPNFWNYLELAELDPSAARSSLRYSGPFFHGRSHML